MNLPCSEELAIEYIGRIFDNTSECYKFFWFKAIIKKITDGKDIISYEELVNEMIVDAWYMVNEFHLNLGPKDTLEALVKQIKEISQLATTADREEILRFLKTTNNKEVKDKKRILTYNVPYRLQSPFIKKYKEIDLWRRGERKIAEIINKESKLLYYFNEIQGIKSTIRIQEDWINYILKNREIIIGWLEYNIAQKVIIYRIGVNIFQRYRN